MAREGDETRVEIWWPSETLHQDRAGANAVEPLRIEWYDGQGNRLEGPAPGWSAEPWKERELPEGFHEVRPGVMRCMLDASEEVKQHLRAQGLDI